MFKSGDVVVESRRCCVETTPVAFRRTCILIKTGAMHERCGGRVASVQGEVGQGSP